MVTLSFPHVFLIGLLALCLLALAWDSFPLWEKVVFFMAEKVYSIGFNVPDSLTERVTDKLYLAFLGDTLLSKPTSKRYHKKWGKHNIAQCLLSSFAQAGEEDVLIISNGTYTVTAPFGALIQNLESNLAFWIENETFSVKDMSGESSVKVAEQIDMS